MFFFPNTVNNNKKNNKKTSYCLCKQFVFLIRNTRHSLVTKNKNKTDFVENCLLFLQTPFALINTKFYERAFTLPDLFIFATCQMSRLSNINKIYIIIIIIYCTVIIYHCFSGYLHTVMYRLRCNIVLFKVVSSVPGFKILISRRKFQISLSSK